jgi:hypothetical protein
MLGGEPIADLRRGQALIAFGKSIQFPLLLADAESLSRIEFAESAPKGLTLAARRHDVPRLAELLARSVRKNGSHRHHDRTKGARNGSRPKPAGTRSSLWSQRLLPVSGRALKLIEAWRTLDPVTHSTRREGASAFLNALDEWLGECSPEPALSPLEALVLFEILRDAGDQLFAHRVALWTLGLAAAIKFSTDGPESETVTAAESANAPGSSAGRLTVGAELAWQGGLLFGHVSGAWEASQAGRDFLRRQLLEKTDSAGIPFAETVHDLPAWLVVFVRAREWGRYFARPLFDSALERRFRGFLWSAARLCRPDGKFAFSTEAPFCFDEIWSVAAPTLARGEPALSPSDRFVRLLANGSGPRTGRRIAKQNGALAQKNGGTRRPPVAPAFQSDEGRLACLRSDWGVKANSLIVSHQGRFPTLELSARGEVVLRGDWEVDVRLDGQPLPLAGPWTCSCWSSDDDGDYLELTLQPSPDLRIERQALLARGDAFLFLADAVIATGPSRIEYLSRLALAPDTTAAMENRTRSGSILGSTSRVRTFPLGLPCERVFGSAGQWGPNQNRLELRQTGVGAVYSPLVMDWNPARARSAAAWHPLTVGENGSSLALNAAAAFRLQIGAVQWLMYRSLSRSREPRTVLGHHTPHETVIGRFTRGNLEPLILVEQPAAPPP